MAPIYFGPDTQLSGMGSGGGTTPGGGGVEGFAVGRTDFPSVQVSKDDPPPPLLSETALDTDDQASYPDRYIKQVGVIVCVYPEFGLVDMTEADVRAYERCVINRGRLRVVFGGQDTERVVSTIPFVQANVSAKFPKGGALVNIVPKDGVWQGTRFVSEYLCLPQPKDNLIIDTSLVLTYDRRENLPPPPHRMERWGNPSERFSNPSRPLEPGGLNWRGRRLSAPPAPTVDIRLPGYGDNSSGSASEDSSHSILVPLWDTRFSR